MQLRVSANKTIVPSSHWPPAWNLKHMTGRAHWYYGCTITTDIMPSILIHFPDLEKHTRPPPHPVCHILQDEWLLNRSHSLYRYWLKCFELFAPRKQFPLFPFVYISFDVKGTALNLIIPTSVELVSKTLTIFPWTISSGLLKDDMNLYLKLWLNDKWDYTMSVIDTLW